MNRLTVGILLSFSVILSVTALNYTPEPISDTSTCQIAPGCQKSGTSCGNKAYGKRCNANGNSICKYKKQDCSFGSKCQQSGLTCVIQKSCGKKAFNSRCSKNQKPNCAVKKACVADCTKQCCIPKSNVCGPNCTKPCCAKKNGV